MPHIALVVDNPFRDLPGLVLVAARLAASGATCHLVPLLRVDMELRALAPDLVLLNYVRPSNERLVRALVQADIGIAVHDTEGGVLTDLGVFDRCLLGDADLRNVIALYCVWGEVLAEHLVKAGFFRADRVALTGAPRFDFYAPQWRAAALAASPYAGSTRQPMVLVNGNFTLANPRFQSPEQELRVAIEVFGEEPDEALAWQSRDRAALEGTVAMINHLAARHPDTTFLMRPHPFERLETYQGMLDDRPNLRLEKRGTVDGWILRSSAVLQRSCTTAIEAGMAGVPALSPDWIPSPMPVPAADAASVHCATLDELDAGVAAALTGSLAIPESVSSELGATVRKWFRAVDGRSAELVADALLSVARPLPRERRRKDARAIGEADPTGSIGRRSRAAARVMAKAALPGRVGNMRRGRSESVLGRSDKSFSVGDVTTLVHALGVSDADLSTAVTVGSARADYANAIRFGRTVTIRPTGL